MKIQVFDVERDEFKNHQPRGFVMTDKQAKLIIGRKNKVWVENGGLPFVYKGKSERVLLKNLLAGIKDREIEVIDGDERHLRLENLRIKGEDTPVSLPTHQHHRANKRLTLTTCDTHALIEYNKMVYTELYKRARKDGFKTVKELIEYYDQKKLELSETINKNCDL